MSDQGEPLKDLLEHPGWTIFTQHVQAEWGAGGTRFESTLNAFADSREEDVVVLQQIRQIAVARREILRLLCWPGEEVQRLKNLEQQKDTSPRRPMPVELAGQGRRGSL